MSTKTVDDMLIKHVNHHKEKFNLAVYVSRSVQHSIQIQYSYVCVGMV